MREREFHLALFIAKEVRMKRSCISLTFDIHDEDDGDDDDDDDDDENREHRDSKLQPECGV